MINKRILFALIGALMVGIILDRVLANSYIGFGLSLCSILFTIIFFILYGTTEKYKAKKEIFLLIPIFIIIVHSTIYTNPILFYLNLILLPLFIIGIHLIYHLDNIPYWTFTFLLELICKIFAIPFSLHVPFAKFKKYTQNRPLKNKFNIRPEITQGILISIPIIFIVIILLSSSDMVFNYYISKTLNSLNIFKNFELSKVIIHTIIISIIIICILTYMWSFDSNEPLYQYGNSKRTLHPLITVIPITMLNIIYLLFSIVQFSYLYSGGTLPNNFNYSEYARRGFFELITITIINFIIILIGINKSIKADKKLGVYSNILYSFLILFTLNMLYSAHFKLKLYETTYGYTYLRVFVHLFMLLLLLVNIINLIAIWYTKFNLCKTLIVASIIFYSFINTLNIDGFIAKENIALYKNSNKIDISYITSLSYEAVPYAIKLKDTSDTILKNKIEIRLSSLKYDLYEDDSFLDYNLSKENVKKLLKQ